MNRLIAITAAVTSLFAGQAFANDNLDPRYFEIDESSIMIEEITDRGGTIPPPGALPKPPSGPQINPPKPSGPTLPGVTGTATDPNAAFNNTINQINSTVDTMDKIVNLVEKIFAIIEKNQPVVNITTNYANAVPFGTSHWTQLQGWSKPTTKKYAFSMKNAYGSEVVKVAYQVHYTANGNFQGKGKFLTGVTVEPISVTTAWGYKVTLVSEVPDSTIANVGTHEDPIASMQVQLKWTVHTMIKDMTAKNIYYVQGDGFLQEIGAPFKNAQEARTQGKVDAASIGVATSTFN
ncbi:MAG: hypothetical protein AB7V08_01875 [Elusimicrobiales bacterium]